VPDNEEVYKKAKELRPEWVIEVVGKVSKRPSKMVNPKIETGKIELAGENLEVFSQAKMKKPRQSLEFIMTPIEFY
jgi:aspartyl-tRNA synthetase